LNLPAARGHCSIRLGIIWVATARNLRSKRTFPSEVIEMSLAHTVSDAVVQVHAQPPSPHLWWHEGVR